MHLLQCRASPLVARLQMAGRGRHAQHNRQLSLEPSAIGVELLTIQYTWLQSAVDRVCKKSPRALVFMCNCELFCPPRVVLSIGGTGDARKLSSREIGMSWLLMAALRKPSRPVSAFMCWNAGDPDLPSSAEARPGR